MYCGSVCSAPWRNAESKKQTLCPSMLRTTSNSSNQLYTMYACHGRDRVSTSKDSDHNDAPEGPSKAVLTEEGKVV